MQRGSTVLLGVVAMLAALAVSARAGAPTGGPDEQLIGPPSPVESVGAGSDVPGESTPGGTGPSAEVESRPLGPPGAGSFRERRAAGELGRLGESGGRVASLKAGEGWWRTAGALAIIIALILAAGAGVRRWAGRSGRLLHAMGAGGRAPSGLLHVLGRYPVGRGQTLILLKLDRRVLLVCQSVGVKGAGMRTLCEIGDPEEVASIMMLAAEAEGRSISARFRELVSGFETSHLPAEAVVAPVEVPGARPRAAGAGPDPVGRLHSRLDSLRQAGWGDPA